MSYSTPPWDEKINQRLHQHQSIHRHALPSRSNLSKERSHRKALEHAGKLRETKIEQARQRNLTSSPGTAEVY
jgi:hypothetical protein